LAVVALAIVAGRWLTLNLLTQNVRLLQRIEEMGAIVNEVPRPAAIRIAPDGTIASRVIVGSPAILQMLGETANAATA
jgi:hypothetical protein